MPSRLRPYARGSVPAPTGLEAVAFDLQTMERSGVPQVVLMENAGRAAADVLQRLFPEGRVVSLVGGGNNGGDALVMLRTLLAWGRDVRGVLVADRPANDPLLRGWPVPLVRDGELDGDAWGPLLERAGVIVDGVLGTGARGAPRERLALALERMNASGRPVVALDVPSGIDASTGEVPGVATRADVTIAFGAPKLGSLLHPARARVGRLIAVEVGFPPSEGVECGALLATPVWARARIPERPSDTHKKAVGSVLIVAGRVGMAGAAVLAARAAFRAGVGLVRVASHSGNRDIVQAAVPEAIWVDAAEAAHLQSAVELSDALALGPGLGTDTWAEDLLDAALSGTVRPTVLDADALNLAAAGRIDLAGIAGTRPLLITPHPGEMARLMPAYETSVPADAASRARAAAHRFGCAVVLKGAPSVVAAPGAPVLVDTQASSDLAVAGLGDALTGVAGALLAQGLEPQLAGAVGLYLTGRAARVAGRGASLTPSDVIRHLPDALGERVDAVNDLGVSAVTFDADAAR